MLSFLARRNSKDISAPRRQRRNSEIIPFNEAVASDAFEPPEKVRLDAGVRPALQAPILS